MVLGYYLNQPAGCYAEVHEVLKDVHEPVLLTGSFDEGIKGYDTCLSLGIYLLPIREMFPRCADAADLCLTAVLKDYKGVPPVPVAPDKSK